MLLPLVMFFAEPTTLVLFISIFLLSFMWWRSTRTPPGIPPGPTFALPVLGHSYLIKKDPRDTFNQWRKQYGDVFSFYQGPQLVVVLCGYRVMKEALVKYADAFSGRPKTFWAHVVYRDMGLSGSSGSDSKEQRKICLEVLGRLGMGKNVLQDRILEEIGHYLQAIQDYQGAPTDLWDLTHISVSNNMCSILLNKRFHYDDPMFTSCMKALEQNLYDSFVMEVINFIPFKQHIPTDPFHWKAVLKRCKYIEDNLLKPCIREQKNKIEQGASVEYTNFVEGYLREMQRQQKEGITTSINEEFLVKTMTDLWAGGTETSATSVSWMMAHFARYQHVQDKCYQDIVRVIGTDRPPRMEDKPKMVYLNATILETLRFSVNVPLSVPHNTAYDVKFMDYVIPKNTMIYPYLESALHDPYFWGDPENFRPERFISPEGKLLKPEEHVAFSLGRRQCLGQNLAYMELYLYIASLLQRFHFMPPDDGKLPPEKGILGIVCSPEQFKVRAVPRH